jgi:hypothetical protein
MALIALPPIYLRIRRFDLDVPGLGNRSEWTGTRQYIDLPGAETWYAKAAFLPAARERDKRHLRAFLWGMRGGSNWFRLSVAAGQHPGPNPTVAEVLDPNTIRLSSAAGLSHGMYATFVYPNGTTRLVGLSGDPAGNVVSFEPFVRVNPAVGSVVEVQNPYCEMSLSNPRNGFDEDDGVATLEFDAEEK